MRKTDNVKEVKKLHHVLPTQFTTFPLLLPRAARKRRAKAQSFTYLPDHLAVRNQV